MDSIEREKDKIQEQKNKINQSKLNSSNALISEYNLLNHSSYLHKSSPFKFQKDQTTEDMFSYSQDTSFKDYDEIIQVKTSKNIESLYTEKLES